MRQRVKAGGAQLAGYSTQLTVHQLPVDAAPIHGDSTPGTATCGCELTPLPPPPRALGSRRDPLLRQRRTPCRGRPCLSAARSLRLSDSPIPQPLQYVENEGKVVGENQRREPAGLLSDTATASAGCSPLEEHSGPQARPPPCAPAAARGDSGAVARAPTLMRRRKRWWTRREPLFVGRDTARQPSVAPD